MPGHRRACGHAARGRITRTVWQQAFRALPVPVIGRIEDGQFRLDLRCLEDGGDERAFVAQLALLDLPQRT